MLLSLYEQIGLTARRESAKSYCGPCPNCGGEDRFVIRPGEGRWFCRGCAHRGGDIESFLMQFKNMTFSEACKATGRDRGTANADYRPPKQTWTPKEAAAPEALWSNKAKAIVADGEKGLWKNKEILNYLKGRGLEKDTVKSARLGWNPQDRWFDRESWGLPPEVKPDGRPKKLWLPAGLIIPCFDPDGKIIRLRVRRVRDDNARYVVLAGSDMRPMTIGPPSLFSCVVESELDAILIGQETTLATPISLGSVQARPDTSTTEILKRSKVILLSLDFDPAGAKQTWNWWKKEFPNCYRWPTPVGKDPTDFYETEGDLEMWIESGIESALNLPETFDWCRFIEKSSIAEYDCGLSRYDADKVSFQSMV